MAQTLAALTQGPIPARAGEPALMLSFCSPVGAYPCRRRFNLDPPCRLNFDPGMDVGIVDAEAGYL